MATMVDLTVTVVLFYLTSAAMGYLTPKFLIWGLILGGGTKVVTILTPTVDMDFSETVVNPLLNFSTSYFEIAWETVMKTVVSESIIASVLLGIIVAGGCVVYIAGSVMSLLTWPELVLMRVVIGAIL
jgi:hypothetical protein